MKNGPRAWRRWARIEAQRAEPRIFEGPETKGKSGTTRWNSARFMRRHRRSFTWNGPTIGKTVEKLFMESSCCSSPSS